jgi:hypothetical protein
MFYAANFLITNTNFAHQVITDCFVDSDSDSENLAIRLWGYIAKDENCTMAEAVRNSIECMYAIVDQAPTNNTYII